MEQNLNRFRTCTSEEVKELVMDEVGSYDKDKVIEWLMSLSPEITMQSAKEFIERYLD